MASCCRHSTRKLTCFLVTCLFHQQAHPVKVEPSPSLLHAEAPAPRLALERRAFHTTPGFRGPPPIHHSTRAPRPRFRTPHFRAAPDARFRAEDRAVCAGASPAPPTCDVSEAVTRSGVSARDLNSAAETWRIRWDLLSQVSWAGGGEAERVRGEAGVPWTGLAGGPEQKCSALGLSLSLLSAGPEPGAGGGEGLQCAPPIRTPSRRAAPLFADGGGTPFFLDSSTCAP